MSTGQSREKTAGQGGTVAASLVSGIIAVCKPLDLDTAACLRGTGIDEQALLTPTARVDYTGFSQLLTAILQAVNDDAIGVRLGRELAFSSYNALGYAAANEATLFDALRLLPKYESLVVSRARTEIIEHEKSVEVCWSMAGGEYLAVLEGLFFASWISLGRVLADADELTATVHFTHRPPASLALWRETFGPDLEFDCPTARFILDKRFLALPIASPDPFIQQVMTREAEQLAASINSGSLTARVSSWLAEQLPSGEPGQQALARHLNMSERTLRRRLLEEKTSYRELLDTVRKERATYYVKQTSLSVQEIAGLLGYRHPTAFNAAYKRWMGSAPGATRN